MAVQVSLVTEKTVHELSRACLQISTKAHTTQTPSPMTLARPKTSAKSILRIFEAMCGHPAKTVLASSRLSKR